MFAQGKIVLLFDLVVEVKRGLFSESCLSLSLMLLSIERLFFLGGIVILILLRLIVLEVLAHHTRNIIYKNGNEPRFIHPYIVRM